MLNFNTVKKEKKLITGRLEDCHTILNKEMRNQQFKHEFTKTV